MHYHIIFAQEEHGVYVVQILVKCMVPNKCSRVDKLHLTIISILNKEIQKQRSKNLEILLRVSDFQKVERYLIRRY